MAVSTLPIIPLYRVQPDPNARFQRFGLNDSQLFGKPLDLAPASTPLRAPEVPRRTTEPTRPAGAAEPDRSEASRPAATPAMPAPAYGLGSAGGSGERPQPGTYVNVLA